MIGILEAVTAAFDPAKNAFKVSVAGGGLGPNVFSPMSYGAVGDGVANDTAAVQTAITAASLVDGGWVWIDRLYRIKSKTTIASFDRLIIRGTGAGGFIIDCGAAVDKRGFVLTGMMTVAFEDLDFFGTQISGNANGPDGDYWIDCAVTASLVTSRCAFWGALTSHAVIRSNDWRDLNSAFWGCASVDGCVRVLGAAPSVHCQGTRWQDYQDYSGAAYGAAVGTPQLVSLTPQGVGPAWVVFEAAGTPLSARCDGPYAAIFDGCGFDEGACPVAVAGGAAYRVTMRGCNALITQTPGQGWFIRMAGAFANVDLISCRAEFNVDNADPVNGAQYWFQQITGTAAGGHVSIRSCSAVRVGAGKATVLLDDTATLHVEDSDVDLVAVNTFIAASISEDCTWKQGNRSGVYLLADGAIGQYDAVTESATTRRCLSAPVASDPGVVLGVADQAQTDGRYLRVATTGVVNVKLDPFGVGLDGVAQRPLAVSLATAGRWAFVGRAGVTNQQLCRSIEFGGSSAVIRARWMPRTIPAPAAADGYDLVDRADSAVSAGSATSGGAWAANRGTWGVSGNAIYLVVVAPGVGGDIYHTGALADNVALQATFQWDEGYGLKISCDGAMLTEAYLVFRSGLNFQIYNTSGGVSVLVDTVAAPVGSFPGVPDTYCWIRRGRNLTLIRAGVQTLVAIVDATAAQPAGTGIGLAAFTLVPVGKFANLRWGAA